MAWTIDQSHSEINFSVRHMMISNVRGSFEKFSGTIDFDEANPANTKVDVKIEAASINTRDERRDAHLKSPDFLDAENHPYLIFKSQKVEVTGEKTGRLIGDLTIRDITREVVLDVEYAGQALSPWGTTSAGFSATTRINRKDWNLTWNQTLETGGVLVGDEIRISIELEIIKQEESQAEAAAA
jgi:polyisoprenoid-binding protein YceI